VKQEYADVMIYALVSILKRPGEFDQPLTYKLPDALVLKCKLGQGVLVPLRGKQVRGVIVELQSKLNKEVKGIKEIEGIIPELKLSERSVELAKMISDYYRCSLLRALKLFIPKTLWKGKGVRTLKKIEEAKYNKPNYSKFPLVDFEHELTSEQKDALKKIENSNKPILLHGVTGSGKTEVYLRAILEGVKYGKQTILLVPEIALTPQMIEYFAKYFGKHMAVFHSKLSDGEKLHEHFKAKSGYAPLIIGSRSAIFAPVLDLGVIIIDEEHEWTYKQESSPYYETHRVAEMLQALTSAKLILGTATPRLETIYKARHGDYEYAPLSVRINKEPLPKIIVVDLREEFKMKNFSIFSHALFSKIKERLENKEQVILFVNQRGVARAVMCRDCGETVLCPSCEVSLKLHGGSYGAKQFLLCHYCEYRTEPKLSCDGCSSVNIRHVGIGTQRVEEEVMKSFPGVRVVRADKDTTSDKLGFKPIYEAFKRGEYDVLIGTQMVAKGLDFPNVTLIGIILADIGLHIPDFRSHERLFHLITQVSGRAGRGERTGEVVLQTYQPDHHAIVKAANYQYDDFIDQEIRYREKLKYPPFSSLIKFTVVGENADKLKAHVKIEQEVLEDILKVNNISATVLSAPSMIAKMGNRYYYNVLIRGEDPKIIFKYWKVPKGWRVDIDPIHTT